MNHNEKRNQQLKRKKYENIIPIIIINIDNLPDLEFKPFTKSEIHMEQVTNGIKLFLTGSSKINNTCSLFDQILYSYYIYYIL